MKKRLFPLLICAMAVISSFQSRAEDIDIFVGASAGVAKNPKVLIILENTANWSRASQKWPGGLSQGESEAKSIRTLVNGAGLDIDIGLMEYATAGSGNSGGFIRKAVTILDPANKATFSSSLDTIQNNINSPNEKVNSSMPYGDLMLF